MIMLPNELVKYRQRVLTTRLGAKTSDCQLLVATLCLPEVIEQKLLLECSAIETMAMPLSYCQWNEQQNRKLK